MYRKIERKCSHRFPTATERLELERDLCRIIEAALADEGKTLAPHTVERVVKTIVRSVASQYERDR